ncbi:RNA polymerase sigma factor RpoD/SigA [Candidatus Peregrinibacteria bacterium]|nr:RNA polymerase sigma factor RpoD/SigA [Candidatus Peregrinibacteria bacterium]
MRNYKKDYGDVNSYLKEISQFHEIPHEELMQLIEKAQAGDKTAKEQCVKSNLRYVVAIAKEYLKKAGSLSLSDLIQEGNIGLMITVDRFDTKRGYRFSTYATWWIRAQIVQAIRENSRTIRMPANVHQRLGDIGKLQEQLAKKLVREPTEDELYEFLMENGFENKKTLNRILKAGRTYTISIHGDKEEDALSLEDILEDPNAYDEFEDFINFASTPDIEKILSVLSARERLIILARFRDDRTLQNIGDEEGVSRERVRQLEAGAIRKIKERFGDEFAENRMAS